MLPLVFLVAVVAADTITPIELHKLPVGSRFSPEEEQWRKSVIDVLWKERESMGHTPLVKFEQKGFPNVAIYMKNETATPTKTLKHRFVWALLMWAVIEGKVGSTSTIYDSTSGNTGASEAYMCSLVGIPYVAVVAKELEEEKVNQITGYGGKIMKVEAALRNFHAEDQAQKTGGYFINQFGNADRAEEFHESGGYNHESTNVFHEILQQLKADNKTPDYFIHSAGTGGTISSVGRYVARYGLPTRVVLSDSKHSLFFDYVVGNKFTKESGTKLWKAPGVAGIGYGYNVKPVIYGETTSLVRSVVHEAMKMPDIASTAAMQVLRRRGYDVGASTSLNLLVALSKAHSHKKEGKKEPLTIVTIFGDPGYFYDSSYHNETWLEKTFASRGGLKAIRCWEKIIESAIDTGSEFLEEGLEQCSQQKRFRRFV